MNPEKFIGTGVAIVTPFRNDGTIDFKALTNLLEYLIKNKVEYIVALGTTGESVTLSKDEKRAVIDHVIDTVAKRVPVVVGIGGNNTQEVVSCIKTTNFDNIDALLSVTPMYNKPSQKGLYQHYKAVASSCPTPVILYNVPGRTGVNLAANTVIQLANDFENIIAVKEASGKFDQISEIIQNKPDDFLVLSGDDALTMPLISLGVQGVISVTANAFPLQFSEMIRYSLAGDFKAASSLYYKLFEFMHAIFEEGSPSGVKAALKYLDVTPNYVRLPLASVSRSHSSKLAKLIDTILK